MELSIEDIKNKFEKLPEDLKWAIMGANIDEKLMQIGTTQGLNIRQIGQLSLETHAVMLGFMNPDDFGPSIKASLGLPDEKVKLVTLSVNDKIIKGVRERLVELRGGAMPVVENPPKLPKQEIPEPKINEEDKLEEKIKIEDKKITNGVFANKLVNTVSTNTVKTNYSLDNLSKSESEAKKTDPYRMPID